MGQFGGDGRTDLLFYDRAARQGEFHKTDGRGGMTQLRLYDGWRDTCRSLGNRSSTCGGTDRTGGSGVHAAVGAALTRIVSSH